MATRVVTADELVVSHHEAGHAVAAVANGIPVFSATIEPDRELNALGHVRHGSLRHVDDDVMMLLFLAGPCAEQHLTGRPYRFGAEDLRHANTLLRAECRDINRRGSVSIWSVEERLKRAHAPAMACVKHNWTWLVRVARHLAVCRSLSGAHIAHLRWSQSLP